MNKEPKLTCFDNVVEPPDPGECPKTDDVTILNAWLDKKLNYELARTADSGEPFNFSVDGAPRWYVEYIQEHVRKLSKALSVAPFPPSMMGDTGDSND